MPNIGDDTAGVDTFPGNPDRALVTRFSSVEAGTLTRGWAWFDSSSTAGSSAKVIVYSNVAGAPVTLVGASAGAAVPAGGGLVDLGALSGSILGSVDYFIGIVWSDSQSVLQEDAGLSGMDTELANGTLSYASPPATWPGTDISYADVRVNAYAVYTTGGAAAGPAFWQWRRFPPVLKPGFLCLRAPVARRHFVYPRTLRGISLPTLAGVKS